MPKRKRSPLEIKVDILEMCKKPTTASFILYKANLNTSSRRVYLTELLNKKLLRPTVTTNLQLAFLTTGKGRKALRAYASFSKIANQSMLIDKEQLVENDE